jgi:hypothetical protein
METEQLLERWSANKDRPHWIQANRHDLAAATGLDIPERLHEIEAWLDGYKAHVTRRLREAAKADEPEAADSEAATETKTDSDAEETDTE